jgi:hypothetical protein
MSRLVFIICLILLPIITFSQPQMSDSVKNLNTGQIIRLSMIIPGISVETSIAKKITLFTELGSGFSLVIADNDNQFWLTMMYSHRDPDNSSSYLRFFPFAKVEERLYYNINKRKAANKPVINFTGNYISN